MNSNNPTTSGIQNEHSEQQSSDSQAESISHVSVIPLPPPPSYAEASQGSSTIPHDVFPNLHPFEISHRFPPGLFVLRNRSSLKVLDVSGARSQAGTPVIAYNPKRPTLVNGELLHKENNQLFFLDWHGCLCSASSGLRVDVNDYKLVLAKPQPVLTKPTRDSHPPVHFKYDPVTRTISVKFLHDPTFTDAKVEEVNRVDYLLEVQPQSSSSGAPCNSAPFPLEKISEWLSGKSVNPTANRLSPKICDPMPRTNDHGQEEVQDPDLDNSTSPAREVHVISIAPGWREKFPSSGTPEARKWLKRQWDIASIVVQPIDTLLPSDSRRLSSSASTISDQDSPISVLADLGEVLGDLRNEIFRAFKGSPTT